jgi:hypothetical protein
MRLQLSKREVRRIIKGKGITYEAASGVWYIQVLTTFMVVKERCASHRRNGGPLPMEIPD